MLGNEAIARGAWEAGVKVSSAYPGTPSTEMSENIVKYDGIYAEWAPNEKVAAEVAMGASIAGVRAIVAMKCVGLNVASDPLYTASYIGAKGGLVYLVADDPGLYSSQNEQDTRRIAISSHVPVLEPSDSEEARTFTKRAFEISEEYDTPVILRTTTRIAHSQGVVNLEDRIEIEDKEYERNPGKNVMVPANAMVRHKFVIERDKRLAEDGASDRFADINKLSLSDAAYDVVTDQNTGAKESKKVGFITSGIPYQYVKEVFPEASVLKLGMVSPLPKKLIEEFASKVDVLYVIEELEPVIEDQIKSWGIDCIGKELFPLDGEYSANLLREKILGQDLDLLAPAQVPVRPPILCPGCPHRATYSVLKKLKIHASGDIGCYTLGVAAPLSVVDTTLCMGGSISMLHGMEKGKGKDWVKNWVAVIGDSTFLHTGVNSLMNMVYNQATGTVVILDNSTTGMTGHQDHPATGKMLNGETTLAIDLVKLCEGMGIRNVKVVDAFDLKKLEETIKVEVARDELSVIISQSPCALLKSYKPKGKCFVDTEKCMKCGQCLVPGCPAIKKDKETGFSVIDETMCNGCGLCQQLCPFDAIQIRVTK